MPGPNEKREPAERARRATLFDIAREADVSKSTVSRALNGSPNVSPEARRRIREAIDRLGYRINMSARSLRTARTAQVGLLVPAINNETFGEIAERLDEVLRESDVSLAVASSGWTVEGELRALDAFASRGVDAVVVSLIDDRDRTVAARLGELDVPLVLLDRDVRGVACDRVLADHRTGIDQCIAHLAGLGHRRIGIFSGSDKTRPGREHAAAYADAVARLGLDADEALRVHADRYERADGVAGAQQLLDAGATAIIGCAPVSAIAGMLDHLSERGLSIPGDISFTEFTDSALATVNRPQLSVILRSVNDMGRHAGRMALARMAAPDLPLRVEIVPTAFLDRESTAAPRIAAARS